MNSCERIQAGLDGKTPDRIPVGFWGHFPQAQWDGEHVVQAHLDFVRQSGSDILKVMNENILWDGRTRITRLEHIGKFRGFTRRDALLADQFEMTRRVCDAAAGQYPTMATIHGLYASLFHQTGFAGNFNNMGYGLVLFCRERPAQMHRALRDMTDTLLELVDLSVEAGVDGVMYCAMGEQGNHFTDEEYAEFCLPYELEIYRHIQEKAKFDLLHLCKDQVRFERFAQFHPKVVNWGLFGKNPTLEEGAEVFADSVILGGMPVSGGVLQYGTEEAIREYVRGICGRMEGRRFILGADCTYPACSIDPERLAIAAEAAAGL